MEHATTVTADPLTTRLAARLKQLRHDRGWSLADLATTSGISRATLSRLENGSVSPTATVLGKLGAAYAIPLSRIIAAVEDDFSPHLRPADQPVWHDKAAGFHRRSVSPPAATLAAEVLRCTLDPGATIAYDRPSRPGLEHHLVLLEGDLELTVDAATHHLAPGDSLRYKLHGPSRFHTAAGADYLLVLV